MDEARRHRAFSDQSHRESQHPHAFKKIVALDEIDGQIGRHRPEHHAPFRNTADFPELRGWRPGLVKRHRPVSITRVELPGPRRADWSSSHWAIVGSDRRRRRDVSKAIALDPDGIESQRAQSPRTVRPEAEADVQDLGPALSNPK